ncbi:MAG: hypothetical protein R3201_00100 [Oceanisphaera sp.]|nr:hypothetical protein [Oceanisphaera sp.]
MIIRPLFIDVETLPDGAHVHRKGLAELGRLDAYRHTAPIDVIEAARDAGKLPAEPVCGEVPSRWKDPAKIEARRLELQEEHRAALASYGERAGRAAVDYWRTWSLLPSRCEIATCAFASGGNPVQVDVGAHAGVYWLEEEIRSYQPTHIIAWNAAYDCAVLHLQCLRTGTVPHLTRATWMPHYSAQARFRIKRQVEPLDLMGFWHQVRGKGEGSLDTACRVLLGERPDNPISGAEVFDAFFQGRGEDIARHNKADVRDLREVWGRLADVAGLSWDGE